MKNLIIILLFVSFAAKAQQPSVYYPTGEKYQGKNHTIEAINVEMEVEDRVYHFSPFVSSGDDITTVGFLLFTDSALWVLTHRPEVIDSAVKLFDKDKFYRTPEFKIELDAFIANRALTDEYILSSIGEPDRKTSVMTKQGKLDRWIYYDYDFELILQEGLVTHHLPARKPGN